MMVLNIVFLNTYNTLIKKLSKVFEKKIFDIKFVFTKILLLYADQT